FGAERVLVLLFEELTGDWDAARARLEAFLGTGLPPGPLPRINAGGRIRSPLAAALLGNERLKAGLRAVLPLGLRTRVSERLRSGVAMEKPALPAEMRAQLRRAYAGDVAELEALIGRPTGWPAA